MTVNPTRPTSTDNTEEANTPVHLDLTEATDGWTARWAVRLETLGTCEARAEMDPHRSQRLLDAQVDFLSTLAGLGPRASAELRHCAFPRPEARHRGRIEVALRIRIHETDRATARIRALEAYRGIFPNLVAMDSGYAWVPVTESWQYDRLFSSRRLQHFAEIRRRQADIRLSAIDLFTRNQPIGFAARRDQAAPEEADAVQVVAPFVGTRNDLGRLYDTLLLQDAPVVLSTVVTPTQLRQEEFGQLLHQSSLCESFLQDKRPRALPLRLELERLQHQLADQLESLRDGCWTMAVQVASSAPISTFLVEAIGTAISGQCTGRGDCYPEPPRGIFLGGCDSVLAGSDEAQALTRLDGIPEPEGAGLRLRRLFSTREANCAFRFPMPRAEAFPGLTTRQSRVLALPSSAPGQGILLGENVHRGLRQQVRMIDADRRQHTYVVGQTGTGKSTLLKSMILQDIEAGHGVAVLDPHGELVEDLLPLIPEGRLKDVIHLNPELPDATFGINLLEHSSPMDRDMAINALLEIFQRLYSAIPEAMGPAFEQYFRNAALLEMGTPTGQPTLTGILRVFSSTEYRSWLLQACQDPLVQDFWEMAVKVRGDHDLTSMGQWVMNKLNRFLYNDTLRRILLQPRTTIPFREIMDQRGILLVDLCKGGLGGMNTAFLGMALVHQIQRAAFSRTLSQDKARLPDFYLYIDEFQNLATDNFVTILSEARKYGLAAILSNQYMNQIPKAILDAVRGNVGTVVAFRTGAQDAELLQEEFAPSVRREDLLNLPNYHSYVATLHRGEATQPFSMRNVPPAAHQDPAAACRNRRRIEAGKGRYTTPAQEVDRQIRSVWMNEEIQDQESPNFHMVLHGMSA